MVTHNWPEKTKPERYQWKKPEWNKAESIRQKEQARIINYRIGLRQNAPTEQGRNFYQWKWVFFSYIILIYFSWIADNATVQERGCPVDSSI